MTRKPMHPDNYNTDAELASHLLCDTECSVCAKAAMRLKELSPKDSKPLNQLEELNDLQYMTVAECETYREQILVKDDEVLEMTVDYVPLETGEDPKTGAPYFSHYGFALKVSRDTEIRVLNQLRARGMLKEQKNETSD